MTNKHAATLRDVERIFREQSVAHLTLWESSHGVAKRTYTNVTPAVAKQILGAATPDQDYRITWQPTDYYPDEARAERRQMGITD